jgi:hypothetical protein
MLNILKFQAVEIGVVTGEVRDNQPTIGLVIGAHRDNQPTILSQPSGDVDQCHQHDYEE